MVSGDTLGPYRVLDKLGEGGMGQVFRARDTKLNRDVALKVLPDSFANDADRLMRFTREAQTLASLNHPHIAAIYGLEEGPATASGQAGVRALVMELVEGEDLSQRIARLRAPGASARQAGMPLDEALPIAKQIAEALEAAHDQGIVHRDLKPANIKVRADGTVKVLDFGLAKAIDPPSPEATARQAQEGAPNESQSPTITSPAHLGQGYDAAGTEAGMILGTAAYMSPEQARGKIVDKRADIWAFGCVLFEMLTGTRLFAGDSVPETLGLIFSREPDLATLPAATPARARTLIARCLIKDPRQRLRDIGEARLALEGAFETAAPQTPAVVASSPARGRLAWMVTAAAALVAATLGAIAGGRYLSTAPPPAATVRFEVLPPADVTLTPAPVASVAQLALSPDGRRLAFVAAKRRGVSQLWVRPLDSTEAQPLPGTDGASFPFWSPDSRSLAFFATGRLKKIDIAGGAPLVLCDATSGRGGSWNTDGVIVFAQNINSPLVRVAASGGAVTPLTTFDPAQGAIAHYFPQFLPDGRQFLYYQRSTTPVEHSGIYVGSLDSSKTTRVVGTRSMGVYSSGFLWLMQAGSLFAQAFDVQGLRTIGEPTRVTDGVGYYDALGYAAVTVSATGVVAHGPGVVLTTSVQQLVRGGAADWAPTPPGMYRTPRLSPDQKSLAMTIGQPSGNSDLWVLDLARSALSRATSDPGTDWFPVWPPGSGRLFFGSSRFGSTTVFEKTLGGKEALFVESAQFSGTTAYPLDVSRDERFLVFHAGSSNGYDLGVLPLTGERTPSAFLATPFNEVQGRFSPNSRWMAYASDESGRFEIYVRPFPAASGQTQVSLAGGMQPEWRGDGKELFYIATDGKLTAVPVTTDGPAFTAGTPQALFDVDVPETSAPYPGDYAVTADGQRFFVNTVVDQPTRPALTVILNWAPERKQ